MDLNQVRNLDFYRLDSALSLKDVQKVCDNFGDYEVYFELNDRLDDSKSKINTVQGIAYIYDAGKPFGKCFLKVNLDGLGISTNYKFFDSYTGVLFKFDKKFMTLTPRAYCYNPNENMGALVLYLNNIDALKVN